MVVFAIKNGKKYLQRFDANENYKKAVLAIHTCAHLPSEFVPVWGGISELDGLQDGRRVFTGFGALHFSEQHEHPTLIYRDWERITGGRYENHD